MPTKKTPAKKPVAKKNLWTFIETHPIIANPIIVAIYGVLTFLTLEGTNITDPATYKKAATIGLLALFSAVKNAIEVWRKKNAA